ncbi:hypothetical protein V498_07151 [Pseudogymnoascus sp. VKM F-4517 (FW-2822)]|nr:hypothetical protein V498_07151 [Pseudogymnoascus sp. VKM F-4517 (FW-2822)]
MAAAQSTSSILSFLLPRLSAPATSAASRSTTLFSRHISTPILPTIAFAIPASIRLNVPSLLGDIWESVLRAVPKKKTSHMKKRSRFMAGKGLKDVTELNKCSACGHVKRAHLLCPYCVKAHPTDIFAVAVTPTQLLSASGSSTIKIYSTASPDIPLVQNLSGAHPVGCHHIATSRSGTVAASAGFGGELKIWTIDPESEQWSLQAAIEDGNGAGEVWALALSADGRFLASTTIDGRINVWDISTPKAEKKVREYETKGSFGLCVDMSRDGKYTASGHENGAVYVFDNDTGRMMYSMPGLVKPVRTVAFSPAGSRLAAAGDSKIIALYDVQHGEQVANLTGHAAWVFSVDWSDTGEYILSGAFDGKAKVWSVDTRTSVATHSETEKALWSVKWLPKTAKSEAFATAGANRSISFYREATGG